MTYKINKTDGSLLTEIVDSTIDQTATDLTLIGKNVSGFGEYINENFVKILENFASTSQPTNPVTGQLWFDTAQNRLKVYDGSGFKQGSGPVVAGTTPLTLTQGDFWIDSAENQLWFHDGMGLFLAGPIYKDSQGVSGFTVETILDTNNAERVIMPLYVGATLLGIFSKTTTEFTPKTAIEGFSGSIKPGFNAGTLSSMKFNVTASKADALVDSLGNTIPTSGFLRADASSTTSGTLTLQNAIPLILGPNQNFEVGSSTSGFLISSNNSGQDFRFRVKNSGGIEDGITIKATTRRVGIFNSDPSVNLDVTGDVRITGNLTVEGSTTSIETTTLEIEDKNIVIANVAIPTDNTADGAGITVKGLSDKTFNFDLANTGFSSSESINLASGKVFKIGGTTVLSGSALGSGITSAPGITTFGVQTQLTVDNIFLDANRISSLTGDVEIEPNGSGNLALIGTPRITGVGTPSSDTDAATKGYVDTYVDSKMIGTSMDITNLVDGSVGPGTIGYWLEWTMPASNYELGTYARIHCTKQLATFDGVTLTSSTYPDSSGAVVKTYVAVDKAGGSENQPVLEDFDITLNAGNAAITIERTVKLYRVDLITGAWAYQSDLVGPTIT